MKIGGGIVKKGLVMKGRVVKRDPEAVTDEVRIEVEKVGREM